MLRPHALLRRTAMIDRLPPQHPDRIALANELHARPFPELAAPCRAAMIALQPESGAAERDPEADRAHLRALLDRHGAQHPAPGADHYFGALGRARLKWERHTEFVSYTLFLDGPAAQPFDGADFALFPPDWLAEAPGRIIASALVHVDLTEDAAAPGPAERAILERCFSAESLALSRVLDGKALAATDFRLHEHGCARIAVFVRPEVGRRRLGRLVQRLLELETYKSASMLTLPVARRAQRRLSEIDQELTRLMEGLRRGDGDSRATLDALMELSTEIETMAARAAFRFGAGRAYETIVRDRIAALREERVEGRQTFAEFINRRYDPAMRTCHAAEGRLRDLAARAARVADLLRTRVDVEMSAQNQALLESMDRRAALQLRLQETVEGLSVVAISYYAVNLAAYTLAPLAKMAHVDKTWLTAALAPPVVAAAWWGLRRMRRRLAGGGD
ncbi:DUF3422 family protein [Oceanicella actignis]|uniref:DUF3422 family protein n=1 Tax=Oceanicella actignis TaxID=1189325 RepID=UPI00125B2454|nr:DUF3422 domain-containing protein [Oceanicella actignis]TYO88454.1 putative membrane-anchored protein [Oceanicella actignis]